MHTSLTRLVHLTGMTICEAIKYTTNNEQLNTAFGTNYEWVSLRVLLKPQVFNFAMSKQWTMQLCASCKFISATSTIPSSDLFFHISNRFIKTWLMLHFFLHAKQNSIIRSRHTEINCHLKMLQELFKKYTQKQPPKVFFKKRCS